MERILKKASKTHKQRVEVSGTNPGRQRQPGGLLGMGGGRRAPPRGCPLRRVSVVLLLPQDFNRHLDTLTEHYDIPKVSWTK